MSAKLNERLTRAIARTRVVWWVVMIAAALFVGNNLPWWCFILLIPFAFVSYTVLLFITINILAHTVPPEELAEAEAANNREAEDRAKVEAVAKIAARQAAGEEVPPDEVMEALNASGIANIVKVVEVGPVVGRYQDKEIFEYIKVNKPGSEDVNTLEYFGPANIVDGIAQIPEIPGKMFACLENILYVRDEK